MSFERFFALTVLFIVLALAIATCKPAHAHGMMAGRSHGYTMHGRSFYGNQPALDANGNSDDRQAFPWNAPDTRVAPWERGCTIFDAQGHWRDVC